MESYAALFDAYRINKVVVKMVPQVTSLTVGSTASAPVTAKQSFMTSVIDYDDATALTSYNAALEYETFRATPMYRTHKRVLTPALSQQAFKTSGTTIAYMQKRKQWVDAAYGDTEHYGLKFYIQNSPDLLQQMWKVYVTMYVSFKQVR